MPRALLAVLALGLLTGACGDEDPADTRADQVREAAEEAGLPAEVVDVLVLASRGTSATFQVAYPGDDGAEVVVSQQPPHRRVDVVAGGAIVQSRVFRDGVGYECLPPEDDPRGALDCTRREGALEAPGAFTEEALRTFSDDLAGSLDELDLTVEVRTIAEVEATCLVATPKPGPTDGTGTNGETLCLSPEGAQLLVDVAGERVVAERYTTDVPEGTFDVT